MIGDVLPFQLSFLVGMGDGIAGSFLLCRRFCLMMLPTFHGMAAMLPDGFRYLLGFMERLQSGVFFLVLLDTLMGCVLDGMPEDMAVTLYTSG